MRAANKCQNFAQVPAPSSGSKSPASDEIASVAAVGKPRDRNTQRCVKCGKGKTREHAHGRIGKTQIIFYRLQQDRQYLTVNEVKRIDNDQNA